MDPDEYTDETELIQHREETGGKIYDTLGKELVQNDNKIILTFQNIDYVNSIVTYIGGFICRSICRFIRCKNCPLYLLKQPNDASTESDSLIDIKNRGGLKYPSADVITICRTAEKYFQNYYKSKKGIII